MHLRASTVVLAAVAASAIAIPAHAKTVPQLVTATASGIVAPGSTDTIGAFGVPGGDLSGLPFTAAINLNERSPTFVSGATGNMSLANATGDASLTINGTTASFDNVFTLMEAYSQQNPGEYYYASEALEKLSLSKSITATYGLIIGSGLAGYLTDALDYHRFLLSGIVLDSPFFEGLFDANSSLFSEHLGLLANSLTVTSVRAPKPANTPPGISFQAAGAGALAVPEPASWTMMLLGVAALGTMTRRRREVVRRSQPGRGAPIRRPRRPIRTLSESPAA
jgi:hypothetical protein